MISKYIVNILIIKHKYHDKNCSGGKGCKSLSASYRHNFRDFNFSKNIKTNLKNKSTMQIYLKTKKS